MYERHCLHYPHVGSDEQFMLANQGWKNVAHRNKSGVRAGTAGTATEGRGARSSCQHRPTAGNPTADSGPNSGSAGCKLHGYSEVRLTSHFQARLVKHIYRLINDHLTYFPCIPYLRMKSGANTETAPIKKYNMIDTGHRTADNPRSHVSKTHSSFRICPWLQNGP